MKRLVTMAFAAMMCCATAVMAQGIKLGDKYFDGEVLYSLAEIRMGTIYYFIGEDMSGNEYELTLEKVAGEEDVYTLIPSRQAEEPMFRTSWSCEVQSVDDGEERVLLVINEDGDCVVEILNFTTDDISTCAEKQSELYQKPLDEVVTKQFLNASYISQFSSIELQNKWFDLTEQETLTVVEDLNCDLILSELMWRNMLSEQEE